MIQLHYNEAFHNGLRYGLEGNAARINTRLLETQPYDHLLVDQQQIILQILHRDDGYCRIALYGMDYTYSLLYDGAIIEDQQGNKIGLIRDGYSACALDKAQITDGFKITLGDAVISVLP